MLVVKHQNHMYLAYQIVQFHTQGIVIWSVNCFNLIPNLPTRKLNAIASCWLHKRKIFNGNDKALKLSR